MNVNFRVEAIKDVDESYDPSMDKMDVAPYIARQKARAHNLNDDELLITADTIVVCEGEILGKPKDEQDAERMLAALSGRTHLVVSGVCVRWHESPAQTIKEVVLKEVTKVQFAPLSPEEIHYYVSNFKPLDKAGAYGIQEWIGCIGIKSIEGDFYNVMGLPTQQLYEFLKSI